MLHDFLATHRTLLIDRCRVSAAARSESKSALAERIHGIPIFLDQLIETLTDEQAAASRGEIEAPDGANEVGKIAADHGRDLLEQGFTLEQVVRDYGDVCQAVTNLAFEMKQPIEVHEFRTFNRCLDNAIAGAVTEYARQSAVRETQEAKTSNARMGYLAHELRNHLHTVSLVVKALKTGSVGISGATSGVLDRSLHGMRLLIDQALTDVRLNAGMQPRLELIHLAKFLRDIEAASRLEARARGLTLTTTLPESPIAIYADPDLLSSAIGNLLQNALKFTKHHTQVALHAYSEAGRVLIEVRDGCGGLPKGAIDELFLPFVQGSENRSGLGLGLDICRRNVEANGGTLTVRDVPGTGCIFTIALPRHADF